MVTRTVAVLTGTRADYGLLRSSMQAIDAHDELSLSVIVTGMHLSPQHGHTVEAIAADGFTVDKEVPMLLDVDSGFGMAKSIGVGTLGLAEAVDVIRPDILLLLGDRGEPLAGAIAAAHMNVPIAHIHGGDSMEGATIDDSIRHAVTRFSHLHFPVSERSANCLREMGEEDWRITTVGAPGLDAIRAGAYTSKHSLIEAYDLDADLPLVLLVQHPVTTQADRAASQMRATLDAVHSLDVQGVLIYPNADAGGKRMIEVIEAHEFASPFVLAPSVPRADFLGLMAAADVMVGNSSAGIIEAPSFGLPVVDVGPRQDGRERAANVLSVGNDCEAIREAVQRCLADESVRERAETCDNPYDYGGAGTRVAERLAAVALDDSLLRKRLAI